MAKRELTNRQKAAILLITLGPEVSANVFKHLREEEVEQITLEIAHLRKVELSDQNHVREEFYNLAVAQDYIAQGGIGVARDLLERSLGAQKAADIIGRLTSQMHTRPFDFARKADPVQLASVIQNESPQTIALMLAFLEPAQASLILSSLPQKKQAEVVKRTAQMGSASPEVISEIEMILEEKLSQNSFQDYSKAGGIEAAVGMLNSVDRTTEKMILEALEMQDPDLAEEIKKKMFVFENIITLDDKAIQRVLREVDNKDLMLALKTASDEVKEKIFNNMSKRVVDAFKEEMMYQGRVKLKDIDNSQTTIVAIIRRLEEAGEIAIQRGNDDLLV